MRRKNKKTEKLTLKRLFLVAGCSAFLTAVIAAIGFSYLFLDFDREKKVVQIPDLVGKNIEDIDENGFFGVKIEKEPVFSDESEAGVIIAQSPYRNSRRVLHDGEEILLTLTVSLGKEKHFMPDLCGYDCYEAACLLREMGAVVRFASVYGEVREQDCVVRTSKEVGDEIVKGDRITLFISRTRHSGSVRVADYRGLRLSVAIQRIMRDGLVLGEVIYAPADDADKDFVTGQSLLCDTYVKWGARIDLTVCDGKSDGEDFEFNGE